MDVKVLTHGLLDKVSYKKSAEVWILKITNQWLNCLWYEA